MSLQNINRLLGTSPTNQSVDDDVEKLASVRQSREMTSARLKPSLSPGLFSSFKPSGHGLKHTYRGLPIISGILIPFSILLSIPSLTDRWSIQTDANNVTLGASPNSLLLNLGMGFSMACGVLANICIIVRFSERKVLVMTWFCILFLTLHGELSVS